MLPCLKKACRVVVVRAAVFGSTASGAVPPLRKRSLDSGFPAVVVRR